MDEITSFDQSSSPEKDSVTKNGGGSKRMSHVEITMTSRETKVDPYQDKDNETLPNNSKRDSTSDNYSDQSFENEDP
jgi:hypothetical protein